MCKKIIVSFCFCHAKKNGRLHGKHVLPLLRPVLLLNETWMRNRVRLPGFPRVKNGCCVHPGCSGCAPAFLKKRNCVHLDCYACCGPRCCVKKKNTHLCCLHEMLCLPWMKFYAVRLHPLR